jgi:hypothetical protein
MPISKTRPKKYSIAQYVTPKNVILENEQRNLFPDELVEKYSSILIHLQEE